MSYHRFYEDRHFLEKYYKIIVLSDGNEEVQVLVCPALQGKVMTSTAEGLKGISFGWINRPLISLQKFQPHINSFGGEDRFWLGPEGGQFSIFFKAGAPFNLENCYTPAPIDREAFELVSTEKQKVVFKKEMELMNYSGTRFHLRVDREIQLLSRSETATQFKTQIPNQVKLVGFQSVNKITNTGPEPWRKSTGLLSIWILGMFNPSPHTTVICPFRETVKEAEGAIVNDKYFGKVPANRLQIGNHVILFKGDGEYRSKIGLSPLRALPVMGSYDPDNKILTVNHFTLPEGQADYVNSMWELQEHPYKGDVSNSYNHGPIPGGGSVGGFYELESSSPAFALEPGQSGTHIHQTFHFTGNEEELDRLCKKILGVSLLDAKNALPK